ncbi:MAG: DUF1232 domain-containing protein [Desulfuromonadaceae bacterium]
MNTGNNRNDNKRQRSSTGRGQKRKGGQSSNGGSWQQYSAVPMNALRFVAERFLLAKELLTHRDTPIRIKILLVGLVVYIISPVDFIPDMIPILGITDDVALLVMGWNYAERFVTPPMRANVDAILQRWG